MIDEAFSAFLGPRAENHEAFTDLLNRVLTHHIQFRANSYFTDNSLYPESYSAVKLQTELEAFLLRCNSNPPYFHPRYSAQMLKDPALTVPLGYLAFMLSNPNNHAYEGGPVTTEMEMEVTDLLLKMCGFKTGWGHLCSGGSLANLEALWAVRDTYPEGGVVLFSEVSHYSWKRICQILGMCNFAEIPVDASFRMDLNALEDRLKKEKALCVVANIGSTGTGSIDDISAILTLRDRYGFHLHIDAAYGGFFRSVILDDIYQVLPQQKINGISNYVYTALNDMQEADSITIDPHKQGSVSYGAGAVVYKDEKLRQAILNTAPYTYHITDKPNIGMFSLEGSRPGAMAAACYLTYKVLPPNSTGLGVLLKSSLDSAQYFTRGINQSGKYRNLTTPDLDICCFWKTAHEDTVEAVSRASLNVYHENSLEAEKPEFILSKFIVPPSVTQKLFSRASGSEQLVTLRSVFMKHWYSLNDFYYINELLFKLESYD
ncbi:MAG: aspartate aminotransferase family protein [Ignavibacteriales bacterium]